MKQSDESSANGELLMGCAAAQAPAIRSVPTPLPLKLLPQLLKGLRVGSLEVALPNGKRYEFRGTKQGPGAQLIVHDPALVRKLLLGGEVGFGEAYVDGCWDSPDLTRLLTVMYLNEPYFKGPARISALGRAYGYLMHRLHDNTRQGARRNIHHHHGLGNDFYRLWLDETMAYSSAVFPPTANTVPAAPEAGLHQAQLHKFQLMLERLDLRPEHRLLEIGTGWGGFAVYAAQQTGCRVHSISLSEEQLRVARQRAEDAGVAGLVSFELRDYRDISERYERIVAIEMYETVGERYWSGWFQMLARTLKRGGRAAIQGITINPKIFDAYRRKRDFIQKYIFPGGMLCPPGLFQDLARTAGLIPLEPRFYGLDYAQTLLAWHHNVLQAREAIVSQFDERFLRLWRYYLSYSECGFRTGSTDLMQLTLTKPD